MSLDCNVLNMLVLYYFSGILTSSQKGKNMKCSVHWFLVQMLSGTSLLISVSINEEFCERNLQLGLML